MELMQRGRMCGAIPPPLPHLRTVLPIAELPPALAALVVVESFDRMLEEGTCVCRRVVCRLTDSC